MPRKAKHPVRTLEKSLQLLEVLKEHDGERICEIAEHVDFGESAVHNHLSTLYEHGYVVKSDDKYRLSLKFLDLGGYTQSQNELFRAANPVVTELTHKTGERAVLAVEEHDVGVYLSRATSPHSADLVTYPGERFELHQNPSGKAILSRFSQERIAEIFDHRNLDQERRESVQYEIENIRERGYAIGETSVQNERCVATPITTDDNQVLGALGVSAPKSRHENSWFKSDLVEIVLDGAEQIEKNLESMFLRDAWIESSTVRD